MTLTPNDFTHLHVHSEFSLLRGIGPATGLVEDTKPILGADADSCPDGYYYSPRIDRVAQ